MCGMNADTNQEAYAMKVLQTAAQISAMNAEAELKETIS